MQSRTLHTANKFEKEIELAKRRGKDMAKLRAIIDLLNFPIISLISFLAMTACSGIP